MSDASVRTHASGEGSAETVSHSAYARAYARCVTCAARCGPAVSR